MILSYASFLSALIPLGALVLMRREFPARYWIVGLAWLVSVAQDGIALLTGGSWLNTYVGHAILFSLLGAAVMQSSVVLSAFVGVMALLAYLGMSGGMAGPDVWIATVGSVSVLYYARPPLLAPLLAYCGVGTVMYIGYAFTIDYYTPAYWFWIGQKIAYGIAFALFILAAHNATREAI